jgi:hypothetical protein
LPRQRLLQRRAVAVVLTALDHAPRPGASARHSGRSQRPTGRAADQGRRAPPLHPGAETILAGDLSALDLERLQRLFNGKPGPGGGFDVDAYGCAFFLAAFLVDSPRHAIADKTADVMCARSKTPCQLTCATFFGTALATVLRDGAINARVGSVQISYDGGFAKILYARGGKEIGSMFSVKPGSPPRDVPHIFRVGVAPFTALNLIHQMLVAKFRRHGVRSMSRAPRTFKERDVARLLRAATAAGKRVTSIEIENGRIKLTLAGDNDAVNGNTNKDVDNPRDLH